MRNFLRLSLMLVAILSMHNVQAQERTISGKVTSAEEGSPIPGVNVVLKSTTVGTVTDFDGNYKLTVPVDDGTLVFRFIGLTTKEVDIGNQSVIDVVMSADIRQLTEVVVTAVGIQREARALGYSVENVDGDKMQQVSEPDALRALQGKVPGVNISGSSGAPGSSTRITIRGNSSLLGNNQPLFVVDGIPFNSEEYRTYNQLAEGGSYANRLADLDPNNIESMTVLKGAAAAALYGSRAANGVVLITTKTGSPKASRKGLEMTFSTSYAMEKIANLPDLQNTYGTGVNFAYQQANGSWGPPFIGTRPYATLDSIPHWYSGRTGMDAFDGLRVPYRAYPDNVEKLFGTGSIFDNSLSITAGNEKSVLSVTASHLTNDGYVPNTQFDRTNISAGGNTELENGFNVGANLSYIRTEQKGITSGVGSLGGSNPAAFSRALLLGRNWDIHGQPYQNPVDMGSEFMVGRGTADNPLWSYENAGFTQKVNRIIASFNLGYDLYDWLNLSYKIGINTYNQNNTDYIRPGSTGAQGIGRIAEDVIGFEEIESNFLITVTRDINEDFSFRGIFGHNLNQRTTDRQAVEGTQYVVFDIDDIDNTNNLVPFGGDYSQRRLWGLFADLNFGYKNWAFLTLTGRNDWSSTLPQEANSFFYPAITGSVVLTDALGINSNTLSFLKLRAGWSEVGNDTDPYQLQPVYLINDYLITSPNPTAQMPFTPAGGTTVPGGSLSNIERDPNLKPERTSEIEAGIEARLFSDRIRLDLTVYDRESRDQIAGVSLPEESGFSFFFTNFGVVTNKGIEIGLGLTPLQTQGGFNWDFYGTFTHNKNVIEELTEGVDEIILEQGSDFSGKPSIVLRPGQEYGLIKGSVNDRDDEGNLLIDPANGQMIPALDPLIIGNPNPDFIVGLTNTFSFKGVTLNAVFDWRQGGDLWSNSVESMLGRGVLGFQGDRETMRVIPGVYGNPNTHEPLRGENGEKIPNQTMVEVNSLYFGQTFASNGQNEWAVYDGTVFRLREVSLGYEFPQSLIEKTPFGRVSLSLTGRNLWYSAPNFPEDSNYDPEVNQFGATNKQGIEYAATPSVKRYAVNLRVTF
ncbi:MAG: SusC/RagA family TonB-linked outer membrane protein [Cyclobacteriaceae bacterium]|nr:SusC/RagA family TonB-linked outer membrane protein [Cyclobacteriaceae bacterium]